MNKVVGPTMRRPTMRSVTSNRFPVKIFLIGSNSAPVRTLVTLDTDMCKFQSSQNDESGALERFQQT